MRAIRFVFCGSYSQGSQRYRNQASQSSNFIASLPPGSPANGFSRQRSNKIARLRRLIAIPLNCLVNMSHRKRKRIARISRRIRHPAPALLDRLCLRGRSATGDHATASIFRAAARFAQAQNNEMQVFNPAAAFLNMLQGINPYQWGPVSFHPSLSYQFLYGTGIQSSPGNQQASVVQTVSPNFLFVIGSHWIWIIRRAGHLFKQGVQEHS